MHDSETSAPRDYVNAWLTPDMTSRVFGAISSSGAIATRVQWFADQNLVQAVQINPATGATESTLFSVPTESVSKALFEGNTFKLTVNGELYRFMVADDQFTPDTIAHNLMQNNTIGGAGTMLFDAALDDLKGLRAMLEAHNVEASGIRIVRSILIGLGITFGVLFFLILAGYIFIVIPNK